MINLVHNEVSDGHFRNMEPYLDSVVKVIEDCLARKYTNKDEATGAFKQILSESDESVTKRFKKLLKRARIGKQQKSTMTWLFCFVDRFVWKYPSNVQAFEEERRDWFADTEDDDEEDAIPTAATADAAADANLDDDDDGGDEGPLAWMTKAARV